MDLLLFLDLLEIKITRYNSAFVFKAGLLVLSPPLDSNFPSFDKPDFIFGLFRGSELPGWDFPLTNYSQDGAHFVSAEPHVFQAELTPQDQFVVMACDGLWDKLNYEDVINTVTRLRKESKTSTEIAKALVEEALNKVWRLP